MSMIVEHTIGCVTVRAESERGNAIAKLPFPGIVYTIKVNGQENKNPGTLELNTGVAMNYLIEALTKVRDAVELLR